MINLKFKEKKIQESAKYQSFLVEHSGLGVSEAPSSLLTEESNDMNMRSFSGTWTFMTCFLYEILFLCCLLTFFSTHEMSSSQNPFNSVCIEMT